MMDRRELLYRASMILGGALSAGAVSGILAGCTATTTSAENKETFLTADEMRTVTAMADQIIPKTDTPGAVDVGVPAFIDKMLAGFYQERERTAFRAGLQAAATDGAELRGKPFADLTSEDQVMLMQQYDQQQYDYVRNNAGQDAPPHFFRLMKELTIVGFCTSEAGATKLMNYNQTPGPYRGDLPLSEVGKVSAL
ncbi:MAG TPA: gluconate 2-dehydrogenase subunit 3 family protein [Hyphomonadaceae bacterium]|nr:gluconate 2-dehydrogenase subunit 3 family protein [Hyphomonadaceae bacterium]